MDITLARQLHEIISPQMAEHSSELKSVEVKLTDDGQFIRFIEFKLSFTYLKSDTMSYNASIFIAPKNLVAVRSIILDALKSLGINVRQTALQKVKTWMQIGSCIWLVYVHNS